MNRGLLIALTGIVSLMAVLTEWIQADEAMQLAPLTVIGSRENLRGIAGAGDFIDLQDIRRHSYDDINRALRRVPGVYLREEDGFGLFPNISLRGVDAGRTTKVTIMEDGVLAAPAPYAAPAAYYSPTVARMSAIEVLKGSSQIKHGPQTTGGVINFLSTPIPRESSGYVRSLYGSHNEIRHHAWYGDTFDTEFGRIGFLLEWYDRRNEGFKTIDETPDFLAGDRTGFRKTEPMLKLSWEPPSERYQRFEFKIGHTDMIADETYMGLSDADFKADPYRRYAGSRWDQITTSQTRAHLRHFIEWTPELRLTSTIYYNEFSRDWYKERTKGTDIADPARRAVLRGEAPGELRYRSNNREYYSAGVETLINGRWETGEITHNVDAGIRYHQDEVDRFQRDDTFIQAANGAIIDRVVGGPGSGGNRLEEARALAVYAQNAMEAGRWTVIPGLRYEHVQMKYTDRNTTGSPNLVTGRGDSTIDVFAPGLGLIYDLTEEASIFAGVYRGFSLPGPRANARNGIKEETSIGYELGARFSDSATLSAEMTVFYTDFNNLIVPDLIGAGGALAGTENAGDIRTYGVEFAVAYDLGAARDWGISNPWYLSGTLTQAELQSDTASLDEESIFAGGRKGSDVPYIPTFQFVAGTGLETQRWGTFVDVIYVDSTYTTASNTASPFDPSGTPNSAFGKTDSYMVVDLSGFVRVRENVKLVGSVHNLFDNEYLVARHPAGPRPGKPLSALVGFEILF